MSIFGNRGMIGVENVGECKGEGIFAGVEGWVCVGILWGGLENIRVGG